MGVDGLRLRDGWELGLTVVTGRNRLKVLLVKDGLADDGRLAEDGTVVGDAEGLPLSFIK